ncbi:hypothetical protein CAEBREN_28998 [Caenorhabditis brenneri]|uniref:Uncharacterized protein n=1 Tax=Caenorhabditis brenneri TaxID=135651 RepID=G0MNT8_CAEBE|nr:hypothetical protein CAEBREN_28998 [Caenorhabditis brenneri]
MGKWNHALFCLAFQNTFQSYATSIQRGAPRFENACFCETWNCNQNND